MNKLRSLFKARFIREKLFGKYLLATNTVTGGVIMCTGDAIQQRLEKYQGISQEYDIKRGRNMLCLGMVFAPAFHFFYKYLEMFLPGNNFRAVIKKIAVDQLVSSPISIITFFCGTSLMAGVPKEEIWPEIKEKFLFVYLVDCFVFVPCQTINFMFVPPRYRVLYVNLSLLAYDTFLCHVKYNNRSK